MSADSLVTAVLGHRAKIRYSRTWAGYALVGMRVAMGWVLFDAGVTPIVDGHVTVPALVLSLSGFALIFGAAVRLSALAGAIVMALTWATHLPTENALLVDEHVIYVVVLFALGAYGAGRIAGLDAYFEAHPAVAERPWLLALLG